jgi:hypothetical protein
VAGTSIHWPLQATVSDPSIPWLPTDVVRTVLRRVLHELDSIDQDPVDAGRLAEFMYPHIEQALEMCAQEAAQFLIEALSCLRHSCHVYRRLSQESRFGLASSGTAGSQLTSLPRTAAQTAAVIDSRRARYRGAQEPSQDRLGKDFAVCYTADVMWLTMDSNRWNEWGIEETCGSVTVGVRRYTTTESQPSSAAALRPNSCVRGIRWSSALRAPM